MTTEPAPKFCIHCGKQLPPDAFFCPNCGATGSDAADANTGESSQPDDGLEKRASGISSYMGVAVVLAILGCACSNIFTLILGIVAIVSASQVPGCLRSGNYALAVRKALLARVLCWISFGLLAIWVFGWIVFAGFIMDRADKENSEQHMDADGFVEPSKPDRHNNHSLIWDLLD